MNSEFATFWEHLDVLRSVIIRMLIVTMAVTIIAFCFKEALFFVVLAPQSPDFVTYQWFDQLSTWFGQLTSSELGLLPASGDTFSVRLINTELAQQFIIHMKVAFYAGIVVASPYILFELFRFVAPALYRQERHYATILVGGAYVMFFVGAIFAYFVIFPFTFRFLGTYQVAETVDNTITLESYISTMLALTLAMGVVFEMPVMSWLLAKLHLLKSTYMTRFRKHVIVGIVIVAAIITPTSDAFTLMVVSVPMWLLYEVSILIVRKTEA